MMIYKAKTPAQMRFSDHLTDLFASILLWLPCVAIAHEWSAFAKWFNTWVFNDWASINWFVVLLVLDTLTGTVKHVRARTFSLQDLFWKTMVNKCAPAVAWFICVHLISVLGEIDPGSMSDEVASFFRSGVLALYMIGSIFDNVHQFTDGRFPPGWSFIRARFFKVEK